MDLLDRPHRPPEPVELPPRRGGAASAEVIVQIVGEIDICTEPALTTCLAAQLQPGRHLTSLVVDLSAVTYIGVRGSPPCSPPRPTPNTAMSRSA